MKQGTLTSFLNIQKERIVPDNFCLVWEHDSPKITFNKELDTILVKNVNIRFNNANFEVSLYANKNDILPHPKESTKFKHDAIPFFKSLLQKAIRRGFRNSAVFACHTLIQLDPITLYRRLPIIMIEDVKIHKGFSILVWYMLANIPPSKKFITYVLGLVDLLCKENTFMNYEHITELPKNIPHNSLIWSIIFRIEYGGMKGDINMMKYIIQILSEDENQIWDANVKLYEEEIIEPFVWMYEAIDFHIYPKLLCFNFNNNDSSEVKKMCWYNSSSINFRKSNTPYRLEEWKKIAPEIRKLQIQYFNKLWISPKSI
tara:strand:- start:728 stop:1672 length:945 start_codon:yes stop_codon:yes gene_type:complete